MIKETARSAHDMRVIAYSKEIARSFGLVRPAVEAEVMSSLENLKDPRAEKPGFSKLLQDLGCSVVHDQRVDSALNSDMNRVVEIARILDNEVEMSPYVDTPLSERLNLSNLDHFESPAVGVALSALRRCDEQDLLRIIPGLPIFPKIALEVMGAIRMKEITTTALARLAGKDQVLAGRILAVANSASATTRAGITNLPHAISYIGTERAAAIMLALCLQPVLAGSRTSYLWAHSLEAAAAAEKMSALCGVPVADAYVLGLLHDVGHLLLELAPKEAVATRNRLVEEGCEIAVAEVIVFGMDHAQAGALVLRQWGLPEHYVEALRYHHEPQQTNSKLAAMLYLVEFWTGSEEAPASNVRLQAALHWLGLRPSDVVNMQVTKPAIS